MRYLIIFLFLFIFLALAENRQVKFIAVGDIQLGRGIGKKISKSSKNPFKYVLSYLKGADIVFGNLESVISVVEQDKPFFKKPYNFYASTNTINLLKESNFNVLSIANNHSMDYGPDTLIFSKSFLEENGIKSFGAGKNIDEARQPIIVEVASTTLVFLGYAVGHSTEIYANIDSAGVSSLNLNNIKFDIKKNKNERNIVVVSLHWGVEYSTKPTKYQTKIAKEIIDVGADIVLGHHPHVFQPVEIYKHGIIAYSLGNFVFDQKNKSKNNGIVLEFTLKDNKIISCRKVTLGHRDLYFPEILDFEDLL